MNLTMTVREARDYAYNNLRCWVQDANGHVRQLFAHVVGDRMVFSGGKQGEHSIALDVSSRDRIKAHWAGYCENNGHRYATEGQSVEFPSASSKTGMRFGRVIKVGPDRITVAYRYNYGADAQKTLPKHQCRLISG